MNTFEFAYDGADIIGTFGNCDAAQILHGEHPGVLFLMVLLAAKLLATAITLGTRTGPGTFAPTLFLGAVTGTLFGIAVNALWPRTAIDTAAVRNLLGGEEMARQSRTPQIMADAAHAVLCRDAATCTGNFFVDDAVLTEEGVTDFSKYAVDPTAELLGDFFL